MEDSYFFARWDGTRFNTRGRSSCALGHRIARRPDARADGIFAQWSWDGLRLTASNDRYGLFPLFYSCWDGAIAISSSIPRLLAAGAPGALDEQAMSVFLRLGFFIGDDTPYAHIRALAPDASLTWDGALHLTQGARASGPRHGAIARASAIDGYIELFRQAIARRPPCGARLAVPLSGGRDSRHILFELLRQGHRPDHCVTTRHYPPRTGEDARVAAAIAHELGLPHVVLAQTESWFEAERRKNLLTNFCSDEHAWYLVAADYLNARAPVVYDGIGGDVLSAALFVTPRRLALFGGNAQAAAGHLLGPEPPALVRLLPEALYKNVSRERALARLETEVAQHLECPNPVGSFYFWNRTRREIALVPYGLLGALPNVFAPYLDHDLYDFLAGLPVQMLADHAFHSDTIARAYPQYAHIAYEDKHASAPDASACQARFGRELALHLLPRAPSGMLRQRFVRPRLCASLLSRSFSASTHWYSPMALYLHQLGTPSALG